MESLGLPAQAAGSFSEGPCEVWSCNWKTVELFCAMGTQWRTSMNGPIGMDYAALPIVAKSLGMRLKPATIEAIRVMEGEALRQLSTRSSRER